MSVVIKEVDEDILTNIIVPPRPIILLKFQEAQEQEADLADIAELISQDMCLSAAVLKTINSAYYGLAVKVTSLKQAVALLGMKQISILVTSLSLRKISGNLDFDSFWSHSVEIAGTSVFIAQQLQGINVDDAQLFGLFHDCGKIILAQQLDGYQDTLNAAPGLGKSLSILERQRHGTEHALAGALLSSAWCLPTAITVAIRHHHAISAFRDGHLSDEALSLLALHHLVEYLANHNNDYVFNEWEIYADEFMEYLKITENDLMDIQVQVAELLTHLVDLPKS
jgi:HD-like signal output (HDOD) protein